MRRRAPSWLVYCTRRCRRMSNTIRLVLSTALTVFVCAAGSVHAGGQGKSDPLRYERVTGGVGRGAKSLVEVSQPLVIDSGVVIGNVTFQYGEDPAKHPELEVLLTVQPSYVSALTNDEAGVGIMRNAANLARFRLRFPPGAADSSGARSLGVFGDTLVVVMDLSETLRVKALEDSIGALSSESMLSDARLNEVMVKTVDCLLLNARRRWPRIRHLALSIDGSHAYEHWEGVHSLEKVGPPGPPGESGAKVDFRE